MDKVRRFDFSCEMNAELYEARDGEYVFAADFDALAAEHDILVDRSMGAMVIAEGHEGYDNVPIDCPMLHAVIELRKDYERRSDDRDQLRAELKESRERCAEQTRKVSELATEKEGSKAVYERAHRLEAELARVRERVKELEALARRWREHAESTRIHANFTNLTEDEWFEAAKEFDAALAAGKGEGEK